jgi:LmbE family N-acetylglucosaminyl deacetylase
MSTEPRRRAAIVVAHPDDEVIFFGALAARLVEKGWDVDVICATGRFGSPWATGTRRAEFSRACWALGVSARMLSLPDEPGPFSEAALNGELAERVRWAQYTRIFTHGPWGEYGHLHHAQTCVAAHQFGNAVLSLAGPFLPHIAVPLSPTELDRKRRLAEKSYPSQPFAARWCAEREDLIRLSRAVVEFLAAVAMSVGAGAHDAAPGAPPDAPLPYLPADALPAFTPTALRAEDPTFPGVTHIPPDLWRDGHRARLRALRRLLLRQPQTRP